MVLGNVVAIVQTNIKRMLAYSSIAHAGYALIGVVVAGRKWERGSVKRTGQRDALSRHLCVYDVGGICHRRNAAQRNGRKARDRGFAGLAKREPLRAFLMLVFLVSLAGIPPTAGFIGKLYIFMAAVTATWRGWPSLRSSSPPSPPITIFES